MHSVAEELKTNTTYNGWSNRETWVVNLWLSSEPESIDLEHLFDDLFKLRNRFIDLGMKYGEGGVYLADLDDSIE